MFVGHLGAALMARKVERGLPLWAATAASFGIDLLWPVLLLLGIEVVAVAPGDTAFTALSFESYPWSHSLVATLVWGALTGGVVYAVCRSWRGGLVAGALVVSHWILDFLTHRPDLPLWPGGTQVGLGLWNSVPGTLIVEGLLFAVGIVVYLRMTEPRDRIGRWALVGLLALSGAVWLSQPWSPPPPSQDAVATVALAMWILPFWAGWIERHREVRSQGTTE